MKNMGNNKRDSRPTNKNPSSISHTACGRQVWEQNLWFPKFAAPSTVLWTRYIWFSKLSDLEYVNDIAFQIEDSEIRSLIVNDARIATLKIHRINTTWARGFHATLWLYDNHSPLHNEGGAQPSLCSMVIHEVARRFHEPDHPHEMQHPSPISNGNFCWTN